jgi:hypothetical protein
LLGVGGYRSRHAGFLKSPKYNIAAIHTAANPKTAVATSLIEGHTTSSAGSGLLVAQMSQPGAMIACLGHFIGDLPVIGPLAA